MTTHRIASRTGLLHERTVALLETLSGIPGVRATRGALLRAADVALARNDIAELSKLHREVKLLAASLRHNSAPPDPTPADAPRVRRTAAGPGLPGWGQPARRSTAWRREHAPIQYPYGEPPSGWDTRLHDSTTTVPDSRSFPDDLARIRAWRRSAAERAAAEAEAEQAWRERHVTDDS